VAAFVVSRKGCTLGEKKPPSLSVEVKSDFDGHGFKGKQIVEPS